MAALHRALDLGVNFFDTADVYGDGRSERLLARLRKERSEPFYVATKAGRRLVPHVAAGFTRANLTAFVERRPAKPGDRGHRPLTAALPADRRVLHARSLRRAGRLGERRQAAALRRECREGRRSAQSHRVPGVQSVQIIYNLFRQRPAELLFEQTQKRGVGILARLPLSSGLLSGKMNAQSTFDADDTVASTAKGRLLTRAKPSRGWTSGWA